MAVHVNNFSGVCTLRKEGRKLRKVDGFELAIARAAVQIGVGSNCYILNDWALSFMNLLRVFLLYGCLFIQAIYEANGQAGINALTIAPINGQPVVGYAAGGGVGWSFIPAADILITGVAGSAPLLSFWQGSNQIIATFNLSTPSEQPANFQAIPPLSLSAGQLYYVSSESANFSNAIGITVWGLQGTNGLPSFTPSSYLSQFASYYVSTSGWTPTTPSLPPSASNTDYLFYGPDFQFQVVPEPTTICISVLGFVIGIQRFKRGFNSK